MVTIGNLSIHFGSRTLFSNIGFFIGPRDRIGLVGKNGAGKSTLLKTLAGIQNPSEGSIALARGTTVGYLPQEMKHHEEATVYEEASTAFREVQTLNQRMDALTAAISDHHDYTSDDYSKKLEQLEEVSHRLELLGSSNLEEKIEKVLKGLGFRSEDMTRKMQEFSGGWKMRVELGKILLQNPDLLLLDEPTNHLDIESIEWLEEFLQDYPGAIVLISHDRQFLDNVTKRTIEISKSKIYDYKFSYSKYMVQRQDEIERQEREAKNQQKYIEDTQKLIDKFRAKKDKAAFAQTLIRKLDKMERVEVDDFDGTKVRISFPPAPHAGKIILEGKSLGKAYGHLRLFSGVDMIIARGEKIALVGKNGVGKSTLIRMIMKQEPHEGEMVPGYSVNVGYYAQNQADELDGNKTVFETIDDEAVGDVRKSVRSLLGAFLFSGDDVDKKVKVLSGGEKARLALCKLLLQPYNFLVMDEPTNHLDLASKEVLKQALQRFDGTLLVVSHDRDFLHGLTSLVYEIKPDRLRSWPGDVLDFLKEKKAESIALFEKVKAEAPAKNVVKEQPKQNDQTPALSRDEQKEIEKNKKRLQTTIQKSEKEIETLESQIKEMDVVLASLDYSNQEQANQTLSKYEALKKKLEEVMQQWESASEEFSALS
ncbi:MAG: ABC-F family ATP-binding cassette domain-containing protein [Flavobacteriales bacterium]|nr:ABC-F family ATP-binding cassette domain-containing protein [Flavobacteriales bacterium]